MLIIGTCWLFWAYASYNFVRPRVTSCCHLWSKYKLLCMWVCPDLLDIIFTLSYVQLHMFITCSTIVICRFHCSQRHTLSCPVLSREQLRQPYKGQTDWLDDIHTDTDRSIDMHTHKHMHTPHACTCTHTDIQKHLRIQRQLSGRIHMHIGMETQLHTPIEIHIHTYKTKLHVHMCVT